MLHISVRWREGGSHSRLRCCRCYICHQGHNGSSVGEECTCRPELCPSWISLQSALRLILSSSSSRTPGLSCRTPPDGVSGLHRDQDLLPASPSRCRTACLYIQELRLHASCPHQGLQRTCAFYVKLFIIDII